MICSLAKWLVSRREDAGKPLPSWAGSHLRRCPSCREYERFASSLKERSRLALGEGAGIDPALSDRILAGLKRDVPDKSPRPRRRKLVPAPAIAGLLAAVAAGVIWLSAPRPAALPSLKEMIDTERVRVLREEMLTVGSPLQKEKDGLERAMGSAFRFLLESLDPGFGE